MNHSMDEIIGEVRRVLPIQNPLNSFLHNNVLQNFEHMNFFDGIFEASRIYGARALPDGAKYRKLIQAGKIDFGFLDSEIDFYLKSAASDGRIPPEVALSAADLRKILLVPIKIQHPHPWRQTRRVAQRWENEYRIPFRKIIQSWVVPLAQIYLDQGQAVYRVPAETESLFRLFGHTVAKVPDKYSRTLKAIHQDLLRISLDKDAVLLEIQEELKLTQLLPSLWTDYLHEIAMEFKGWSGMIHRLETFGELRNGDMKSYSFQQWLLLLLKVERHLHSDLLLEFNESPTSVSQFIETVENPGLKQAERVALQARQQGIRVLDPAKFCFWLFHFGLRDRYEIFQRALEKTFERDCKTKLADSSKAASTHPDPAKAHFMFCIDDREESIRRHLESASDRRGIKVQTSGVVGFFGLDMEFISLKHPRRIRQCPPVVEPKFTATETAEYRPESKKMEKLWAVNKTTYKILKTAWGGAVASVFLGLGAYALMILRVMFPKFYAKNFSQTESIQQIHSNFSLEERSKRVELICRMAGLYKPDAFPNHVFVISHGSTTSNNPFRQAYGCGACSGNSGAPNSKLFCNFANDPDVRSFLSKKGFEIPIHVQFVSVHHDTCSDEIHFQSDLPEIEVYKQSLLEAAAMNAKERLGKLSPSGKFSPEQAVDQVKSRSFDLAQPRPEYGHSSVAMAVFGPRSWTKDLNLDRRSFLVTYESDADPDGSVLREILIGALPVCANIGLDYFFSSSDENRFGSGSKLPLNVTSLLGVMTGSQSDLRIGLARQMVEIHEPIRMHIFIQCSEKLLREIVLGHPRLRALVGQEWVKVFQRENTFSKLVEFKC